MKKIIPWGLLILSILPQALKAQMVPLFNIAFDSTCLPYTPISNDYIINDALTYVWNFGNGTIISQKNPNYSYTQAGAFKLSLTITTNITDKMVNALTITSIPNTWDDRGNKDVKPDLYFILKDSLGNKILTSNIMSDLFPPVNFSTNFLIKSGKTYTVELWEYDDVGTDDLLAYIAITNSLTTNTFSNVGGTVVIASLTNSATYIQSKDIRLYNQPTVNITSLNGLLTANINGGIGGAYSYFWYVNNNYVVDGYQKTYKPVLNGAYTVTIKSSNCNATSPAFSVTKVSVTDLSSLQNVSIYPNPSVSGEKKWISIQSLDAKNVEMIIFDISGKAINHQNLNLKIGKNAYELPIINATGFYFVHLLQENKTIFLGKTVVF